MGVSIAGKGYIFFGEDTCTFGVFNSEVWEYNPVSDSWTQRANPAQARSMASGFAIGDTGYIGTGYTGGVPLCAKDFWKYLPSTDTWVQMADFGGGYRGYYPVGFSIGAKGYISTGDDGAQGYWDLWEFSPGPVSVNEIEQRIESRIFPNPFIENGILEISNLKNVQIEKAEIKIFSCEGKDVTDNFFIKPLKNGSEFIIENKNSYSGVFFYSIKSDNHYSGTGKFILKQ